MKLTGIKQHQCTISSSLANDFSVFFCQVSDVDSQGSEDDFEENADEKVKG